MGAKVVALPKSGTHSSWPYRYAIGLIALDDLKRRRRKSNHNSKIFVYFKKVLTCWNISASMFVVSFPVLVFC